MQSVLVFRSYREPCLGRYVRPVKAAAAAGSELRPWAHNLVKYSIGFCDWGGAEEKGM
jgi:hypothetical protein